MYKKQEYDTLLCTLHAQDARSVHAALNNDFHWDMAIAEVSFFPLYVSSVLCELGTLYIYIFLSTKI